MRLFTIASEVRAIERRRRAIRRFEIAYEVTLVVESDSVSDLLDAQETRLEEILGPLHAKQSQETHWRHTHIGFEDVAQPPDGEVHRLGELGERQFSTNVLPHHLDDFFYSFIQQAPRGGYGLIPGQALSLNASEVADSLLPPHVTFRICVINMNRWQPLNFNIGQDGPHSNTHAPLLELR